MVLTGSHCLSAHSFGGELTCDWEKKKKNSLDVCVFLARSDSQVKAEG